MAGHLGFLKKYQNIKKYFWGEGMKKDIQKIVRECQVFQRNKGETIKSPGLLHPLHIPNKIWEYISMDFITGLPKLEGKAAIFVSVDRLTKYAHFFWNSKYIYINSSEISIHE
jgi:hypothetical protein